MPAPKDPARGPRNGQAKLTEEDVRYILSPFRSERPAKIAARLGVHKATVEKVIAGRTWGHII